MMIVYCDQQSIIYFVWIFVEINWFIRMYYNCILDDIKSLVKSTRAVCDNNSGYDEKFGRMDALCEYALRFAMSDTRRLFANFRIETATTAEDHGRHWTWNLRRTIATAAAVPLRWRSPHRVVSVYTVFLWASGLHGKQPPPPQRNTYANTHTRTQPAKNSEFYRQNDERKKTLLS